MKNKLVVGMLTRNEKDRYLERVLNQFNQIADFVVIIDDASTDGTPDFAEETLKVPNKIIRNDEQLFGQEYKVRKQLWDSCVEQNPSHILILDADEMIEGSKLSNIRALMDIDAEVFGFRLYDFWSETYYRYDHLWHPNDFYSLFMVKHKINAQYQWLERNHHSGRIPFNCNYYKTYQSDIRVKHMGWSKEEDRIKKYNRYMEYDGNGEYGSLEQYKSILDQNPNLIRWEE